MLIALSASAAELWRWKDADGVVHYSDRPVPGAERIDVRSNQKSTGEFNPEAPPPPAARPVTPANRYTRCAVASPGWILFSTPSRPAISSALKARYGLAVGSGKRASMRRPFGFGT